MRLLNTASITLREFLGEAVPPYAILSHTWEREEVLLADIQSGTASSKQGYSKLIGCCQKAAQHGFEWVWIDTCCIDKTSSAELSEAINSMYQWYESAAICYAYLQDVSVALAKPGDGGTQSSKTAKLAVTDFGQSRWFTRGWTLQELIAPKVVEFYTSEWGEIGTKSSLATALSARTTIPKRILSGEALVSCSVAERMSWASTRQTTRLEDMAYCLLGLFDVNMPLMYGEGRKAFLRLQEQIMRQEEDYTLFAWTSQHDSGQCLSGLLASSPADFSKSIPWQFSTAKWNGKWVFEEEEDSSGNKTRTARRGESDFQTFSENFGYSGSHFKVLHDKDYESLQKHQPNSTNSKFAPKEPPELTSRGLRITLPVLRQEQPDSPAAAWLYCESGDMLICIGLGPCEASSRTPVGRHAASWLISVDKGMLQKFQMEELLMHPNGLIRGRAFRGEDSSPPLSDSPSSWGRLRVSMTGDGEDESYTTYVTSAFPARQWNMDELFFTGAPEVIGVVRVACISDHESTYMVVCCGLHKENPWCVINETVDWKPHEVIGNMEAIYNTAADGHLKAVDRTDRAATLSRRLPGTVFTSAIRRAPGLKQQTHVYTLHIGVENVIKCSPWVQLCLEEERDIEGIDLVFRNSH